MQNASRRILLVLGSSPGHHVPMCNEYEFKTAWDEYAEMMAREALYPRDACDPGTLPILPNIGNLAPVVCQHGNGADARPMRFGLPPTVAGRGPLFNMRSDDRHFGGANRCIVPASAFFEFTGSKYPKTKHRFVAADGLMMGIAGIWREAQEGPCFAMLTTKPGPDIAQVHNRQVVVLERGHWAAWLYLSEAEDNLLKPSAAGSLHQEIVRRVS